MFVSSCLASSAKAASTRVPSIEPSILTTFSGSRTRSGSPVISSAACRCRRVVSNGSVLTARSPRGLHPARARRQGCLLPYHLRSLTRTPVPRVPRPLRPRMLHGLVSARRCDSGNNGPRNCGQRGHQESPSQGRCRHERTIGLAVSESGQRETAEREPVLHSLQ